MVVSLRRSRKELREANNAKIQFMSQISHDILTPLAAIKGFTELLETESSLKKSERPMVAVEEISKATRYLESLFNQILRYREYDSQNLQIKNEPINAQNIVTESVEIVKNLADKKKVRIAVNFPNRDIEILTDPERLKQLLVNLLTNAVKYSDSGADISVRVTDNYGSLRIEVEDSGPGISPEDQKRIFLPFERVLHSTVNQQGLGLGLAISKSIAEAIGGRIGVDSKKAGGSVFFVEIPGPKY